MQPIVNIYKKLQIPFDMNFYNLPISHYENLVESIGQAKVNAYIRELIVYHANNEVISEKARKLKRKLNKLLNESISIGECECGFNAMGESYKECPVCMKKIYSGEDCYYLNKDNSCSLDGKDCTSNEHECGKV